MAVTISGVLARQWGSGGRWNFRSLLISIWILNLNIELYENCEEHSEYKGDCCTVLPNNAILGDFKEQAKEKL